MKNIEKLAGVIGLLLFAATLGLSLRSRQEYNDIIARRKMIEEFDKNNDKTISDLIHQMGNHDPDVHILAVDELVKIGRNSIPALIEALKSNNFRISNGAEDALSHLGPPSLHYLIEATTRYNSNHPNPIPRDSVNDIIVTIAKYPGNKEIIPFLIDCLKDSNKDVQEAAANGLLYFGANAKDAVPTIIEIFKQSVDDPLWILIATSLLSSIGEEAKEAVPVLIQMNKDHVANDIAIISTLGMIGRGSEEAVQYLIQIVKGEDIRIGMIAAQSLSKIGPVAKEAVPALRLFIDRALKDEGLNDLDKLDVVISAADALWYIASEKNEEVISALVKALKTPVFNNSIYSISEALMKIAPEEKKEVIEVLTKYLSSDIDETSRLGIAIYLVEIDDQVAKIEVLKSLNDLIKTAKGVNQIDAIKTIYKIDLSRKDEMISALIKHLNDKDGLVRYNAIELLSDIGDHKAIDPIRELLKVETDSTVYRASISAYKKLKEF